MRQAYSQLLIVVIAMSMTLACSRTEKSDSSDDSGRADGKSAQLADAKAAPDGLHLISAGRSPFLKPRWKFSPGQSQDAEFSSQFTIRTTVGIQPMPETVSPPVTFAIRLETKEVSADGTAQLAFEVIDAKVQSSATVSAERASALQSSATAMIGIAGTYVADSLGRMRDVEFADSAAKSAADPNLLTTLDRHIASTVLPLPEDKIGQGAKWTYADSLQEGGATVRQVSTFEITKLSEHELHARVSTQRHGEKQTITMPGGTPDQSYELIALDSDGTGRAEMQLDALAPDSATMSTKATMKMLLPAVEGQAAQSMQLELATQTSVRAK